MIWLFAGVRTHPDLLFCTVTQEGEAANSEEASRQKCAIRSGRRARTIVSTYHDESVCKPTPGPGVGLPSRIHNLLPNISAFPPFRGGPPRVIKECRRQPPQSGPASALG